MLPQVTRVSSEVLGPPASEDPRDSDERFVGQGPLIKATLVFDVPSAQKAYEEIQFREKNIPCDSLILLSTYSDFRGWNRGVGHLECEPDVIGDPAELFAQAVRALVR